MSQEYTPVDWVDETPNQPGTVINKARLDQMQTAHHFSDGYEEVSTVPTADPGVSYHKVVLCTADMIFYRWTGSAWERVIDNTVWPWKSDIIYYQGSVVLYNGYMYVSLVDNNIDHQPHGDDAYWQLTATQGPQGPAGEVVSAGDMVIRYIGDGFNTVYDVTHNLGTTIILYSMVKGGEYVDATVAVVDEDTVRVTFTSPPTANSVKMAIYSGGMQDMQMVVVDTLPVSGHEGDLVFLTTDQSVYYWDGSTWMKLASGVSFVPYDNNPAMNGTASPGSSPSYSRGDHVHPSDTSKVDANASITGATKCKITYDSKGLVTGGADLVDTDIPNIAISQVTGLSTALGGKQAITEKDQASGYAGLDASAKISVSEMPTGNSSDTIPLIKASITDGKVLKYSTADGGFVGAAIGAVLTFKGSCTYAQLPTTGQVTGDVWNVTDAHGDTPPGTNYAWDGTQWDALGGDVDLSAYATITYVNTGLSSKADMFRGTITGDGSAKSFTVTHDLGRMPTVQVYNSSGELVLPDITVTTTTAVLTFNTAPLNAVTYSVVITG